MQVKYNKVSEIRVHPLTGELVVMAKRRSKRPHGLLKGTSLRKHQPIKNCPFENPQKHGSPEPLFMIEEKPGDWTIQVIPNKYPFLVPTKPWRQKKWFYEIQSAPGYSEVVISRDHYKFLAELKKERTVEFLLAFRERYRALKKRPGMKYVLPFINYGYSAGASISHPHGQIVALGFTPSYFQKILKGSAKFWHQQKQCYFCSQIKWEKRQRKRIIKENSEFISLCPFISINPYEILILPKKHSADFGQISDSSLVLLAEILYDALRRLYRELNNPDFNLFIYSSFQKKHQQYFHWQIRLIPKTESVAGFELSSGMEVCGLLPDEAAQRLRRIKIG